MIFGFEKKITSLTFLVDLIHSIPRYWARQFINLFPYLGKLINNLTPSEPSEPVNLSANLPNWL